MIFRAPLPTRGRCQSFWLLKPSPRENSRDRPLQPSQPQQQKDAQTCPASQSQAIRHLVYPFVSQMPKPRHRNMPRETNVYGRINLVAHHLVSIWITYRFTLFNCHAYTNILESKLQRCKTFAYFIQCGIPRSLDSAWHRVSAH